MQEYKINHPSEEANQFTVSDSLGINPVRANEIVDIVENIVDPEETDTWTEVYEKVLNTVQPVDAIEAFFVGYVVGQANASDMVNSVC